MIRNLERGCIGMFLARLQAAVAAKEGTKGKCQMKNYRKAKPGEITCVECRHSIPPRHEGARFRCNWGLLFRNGNTVIRKINTCDYAMAAKEE